MCFSLFLKIDTLPIFKIQSKQVKKYKKAFRV
ncbi:Uncharacterised protein [Mycoplasmopsis anatis]|nr:Uncharacterised protein [Mycoplasmopsis anatis]